MKHAQQPWKKTGLCHVCGKDTKLLIHQECGKKMDELNKKKRKRTDTSKRYLEGNLPKFCYE